MASQGWGHRVVVEVKTFYNLTVSYLSWLPPALPHLVLVTGHPGTFPAFLPLLVLSPLLTALPSSEAHFKCSYAPSTCHTCFVLCLLACAASTCWRLLKAKGVPFFLNTLRQACSIDDLQMFVWNEGRGGAPNANLLLYSFAKRLGQFPACT